ncbi:unnamed protein product [Amaranthus hypochondriacus]
MPAVTYFHPSLWGDHFLHLTPLPQATQLKKEEENNRLREEVRKEVVWSGKNRKDWLKLIEAIERLGVAYHFEKEIDEALQEMYETYDEECDDMYHLATLFRILRQHGFPVSSDVFKKFKDEEGGFKDWDVEGILSLYEACHVRINGDDILDEALTYATTQLKTIMSQNLSSPLGEQVAHALYQPLQKGFIRLESKHYISFYQNHASHNISLLNFAKSDFNLLQLLHQKELRDITSWWKELYKKAPFTRDRLVEGYFWILGCYYEPQYSHARKIFIKILMILQVFDDIFDVYGTFDILELLVEAVNRWDYSYVARLPEYFNSCYQVLLETVEEVEKQLAKEGRSYGADHIKLQLKRTCKTWLEEAKWRREKHVPKYEEYMEVARVTIAYNVAIVASFLGMGSIATKDSFEWMYQDPMPKPVTASLTIFRLMNDVAGSKYEQSSREHVASSIQCYMKEFGLMEEEQIYQILEHQVEDAWKDINEGMLRPFVIPKPLLDRILNLARAPELFYKQRTEGYTVVNPIVKDKIASVLVHPIPF